MIRYWRYLSFFFFSIFSPSANNAQKWNSTFFTGLIITYEFSELLPQFCRICDLFLCCPGQRSYALGNELSLHLKWGTKLKAKNDIEQTIVEIWKVLVPGTVLTVLLLLLLLREDLGEQGWLWVREGVHGRKHRRRGGRVVILQQVGQLTHWLRLHVQEVVTARNTETGTRFSPRMIGKKVPRKLHFPDLQMKHTSFYDL